MATNETSSLEHATTERFMFASTVLPHNDQAQLRGNAARPLRMQGA
jgi:hypothetical protein